MSLLDDLLTSAVKNSYEKNKRKESEPSILGALKDPQFLQDMKRGVLDSVNRGAVASTIGGPVDLATMLMRPLGYNVEKPTGGSEWVGDKMQQLGLLGDTRNPIAEAIASVAVPGAMAKVAPKVFQAEQAAIKNAQMPSPMNGALRNQAGAIVWHGSPHKFDKFDSSKIGTGEGAQAYGHGLYLAESPAVAEDYRTGLTQLRGKNPTIKGEDIHLFANKVSIDGNSNRGDTLRDFYQFLNEPNIRPAVAKGEISNADAINLFKQRTAQEAEQAGTKYADYYNARHGDIDWLGKNLDPLQAGSLYKVDLPDEHIAKMLDWDKPLSQQAPEVQKALQSQTVTDAIGKLKQSGQLGDYSPAELQQLRGEDWYDMLRQANGDSNAAPSDFLKQQGIPGIRYLDGGSRGTGQGTSNFVVFPGNEDMLKILERNGQPMGLLGQ